jgi:hypothetical protein
VVSGFVAAVVSGFMLSVATVTVVSPSQAECAAASVQAIRAGVTLTKLPRACRGLPPAELRQAAATAIREVSDHFDKARRRHLAVEASAKVSYLLQVAGRRAKRASPPRSRPAAAVSAHLAIPAGPATLAAWLLTVLSGGYLLYGLLAHGGLTGAAAGRGRRTGPGQRQAVIWLHAGLALAGLVIWAGFLASGWTPVAWAATCLLPFVLGLGMAALLLAISGGQDSAGGQRAPVLVNPVHGALATVTILLALLAAIAAG